MEYSSIDSFGRAAVNRFIAERWYTTEMALRGELVDMTGVDGIVAHEGSEILGLLTYRAFGDALEILSLDSVLEGHGVGSWLIELAKARAVESGLDRLLLITTNDNIEAIKFYQKRGFDMLALHRNALDESRALKPEIPLTGEHGIPLQHEIEFEMILE